jgi:hypothetical protein
VLSKPYIHKTPKETKGVKKASIPEGESLGWACWCPDRELRLQDKECGGSTQNTVSYAEVICVEDITFVRAKAERHMGRALH